MTKLLPLLVVVFAFGLVGCPDDEPVDATDASTDSGTDASTDSGTDASTDAGADGEVDSGEPDAEVDGGYDGGLPAKCTPDATCNPDDNTTCHDPCVSSSVCGSTGNVEVYQCIEGTRCYCLCVSGDCSHNPG